MRNLDRRIQPTGPGGYHCECCGPTVGKQRKKHRRTAKKKVRRLFTKLIEQDLLDGMV